MTLNKLEPGMGKGRDGTVPRIFVPSCLSRGTIMRVSPAKICPGPAPDCPVAFSPGPIIGICGPGPGSRHCPGTTAHPWLEQNFFDKLSYRHFINRKKALCNQFEYRLRQYRLWSSQRPPAGTGVKFV